MARTEISRRSTRAFIRGAPMRIDKDDRASINISGKWRRLSLGDSALEYQAWCKVSTIEEARRIYLCEDYGYWIPYSAELTDDEFRVFNASTDG